MPDSRQFSTAQAYREESKRSFWSTSPLLLLLSGMALYGFTVSSGIVAFLRIALALLFFALTVSLPLVSAKEFRGCVFELSDEYVRFSPSCIIPLLFLRVAVRRSPLAATLHSPPTAFS